MSKNRRSIAAIHIPGPFLLLDSATLIVAPKFKPPKSPKVSWRRNTLQLFEGSGIVDYEKVLGSKKGRKRMAMETSERFIKTGMGEMQSVNPKWSSRALIAPTAIQTKIMLRFNDYWVEICIK